MTTSYVEGLLDDLESLVALARGEEAVAEAARRLSRALAASAATRLLDVMTHAALALSERLPSGHVEVRLVAQDPEFVYVEDEPGVPHAPADDPTTARITLRLSQRLKDEIEGAAEREGLSVNTWLIRTLDRAVAGGRGHQSIGNRLRGFARS